jgi:hypothetical protein
MKTPWIGHPSARRQRTPDGWYYEDMNNFSLAFSLAGMGVHLWSLDAEIERLESEGAGAGVELRERREKMLAAYLVHNDDAFLRHLEWILLRTRETRTWDKARAWVEHGDRFIRRQSELARRPRGRVSSESETTIGDVVARLALREDQIGDHLPARDLWSQFYGELDGLGLDPEEKDAGDGAAIEYDFRTGRRTMTFANFKSAVSRARAKAKTK